jgi:murein L,D-transpeptidase YcbB/YkuD
MSSKAFKTISIRAGISATAILAAISLAHALPVNDESLMTGSIQKTSAAEDQASISALEARDAFSYSLQHVLEKGLESSDADRDIARDHAAVLEFYASRNFKPLWLDRGTYSLNASRLIARLKEAGKDGLNSADYKIPDNNNISLTPLPAAKAEAKLAYTLLRYARDAYAGRIDPASISGAIDLQRKIPDPVEALQKFAAASDPVQTLEAFNPPHQQFKKLRAKLAELRASENQKPKYVEIPSGKTLRLGHRDKRIAVIRERLNLAASDSNLYDKELLEAVKQFQRKNNLIDDGILGPATLGKMNTGSIDKISEIIANMEAWRWMPRDFGQFHVMVNIPEFRLWVKKDGQAVHTTRVVIGKTKHKTPVFSDEIEHVVVNPYWHVPYSIAKKELLPRFKSDPGYVLRSNYEVLARVGAGYRVIDPYSVDWHNLSARSMPRIRQRPGSRNALGSVKFMFPNKHAVYLHDTPSKSLFRKDYRAYSHGCVRVENPMEFADALLQYDEKWSGKRLRRLLGGYEKTAILKSHIPVHLTYFTTRIDEDGNLIFLNDVYGHSTKIKKALNL